MCGIAGILSLDDKPVDRSRVDLMNAVQAHRGPDGEGIWTGDGIVMGHRRLTIIDLSDDAAQPMVSMDGRYVITYNGEVYNYRELRDELTLHGHVFRTSSDTEVVLAAYAEWGADALSRFNGMWGLAVWDTRERTLFCARDRFGVKPFYYSLDGREFVFASEMKAILAAVPEANRPHPGVLQTFVASGLFGDTDETFFTSIKALPPAHWLLLKDGHALVCRFWHVEPWHWRERQRDGHPVEVFGALLADAVTLRLRSDVPVGTCLSGGLDSSSIAALASRTRNGPLQTFSSIYDDKDCDEREFIEAMQHHSRLEPHWVYPKADALPPLFEEMIFHQEIPAAAPGIFSQWNVMETARGRVKVLLDGQGGDELLGGYFPYFAAYLRTVAGKAREQGLRDTFERLRREYAEINALTGQDYEHGPSRLRRKAFWYWLTGPPRRGLNPWRMPTDPSLHPEFAALAAAFPAHRTTAPNWYDAEPLNQEMADALLHTSIPGLLHYEDRSSMAFGIEARTPFLDVNLVEFAMSLPFEMKISGSTTKWILREAMRDVLPEPVRLRRDKKGYPTPLCRWLRGELRDFARDLLLSDESRHRKVLQPLVVERHLKEHLDGRADHSWLIWRWMTLEVWFRRFVDRRCQPSSALSGRSANSASMSTTRPG